MLNKAIILSHTLYIRDISHELKIDDSTTCPQRELCRKSVRKVLSIIIILHNV